MYLLVVTFKSRSTRLQALARFGSVLLAALCSSAAFACPAQLPASLRSIQVGDMVRVNGLQLAIRKVQSSESIQALFAQAEQQWKADGFESKRSANAGWQVLTSLSPTCLATLQLNERGGATGYFTRTVRDPKPPLAITAHAPVPPGATVTSRVSSDDDGRKGLVVTMTSTSSVEELTKFFAGDLHRANWSPPRSHTVKNKATGAEVVFISAQRRREQVDIVLWPDQLTQVVMTISEAL